MRKFAAPLRSAVFPRSLAIVLARTPVPPKNKPVSRWNLWQKGDVRGFFYTKKKQKFKIMQSTTIALQFLHPPSKTIIFSNNSRSKSLQRVYLDLFVYLCMFSRLFLPVLRCICSTFGKNTYDVFLRSCLQPAFSFTTLSPCEFNRTPTQGVYPSKLRVHLVGKYTQKLRYPRNWNHDGWEHVDFEYCMYTYYLSIKPLSVNQFKACHGLQKLYEDEVQGFRKTYGP